MAEEEGPPPYSVDDEPPVSSTDDEMLVLPFDEGEPSLPVAEGPSDLAVEESDLTMEDEPLVEPAQPVDEVARSCCHGPARCRAGQLAGGPRNVQLLPELAGRGPVALAPSPRPELRAGG